MTAYARNAPGNWTTQSEWTPNGLPGDGDTASQNGHALTVDANVTIGTSPAEGNIVLTVSEDLTIDDDITLVVRGDVSVWNNKNITTGEGVTFEFDASQASSPSTTNYVLPLGGGGHGRTTALICNGTSGNPCTVTSNAGGGNGVIQPGVWQSGQVRATWTNFSNLGTASAIAIYLRAVSGSTVALSDCTFDSCGRVFMRATTDGADSTFDRVKFTNTLATNTFFWGAVTGSAINLCSFDTQITQDAGVGGVSTDNYFSNGVSLSGTGALDTNSGNLYRLTSNAAFTSFRESAQNNYLLEDHNSGNPSWMGFGVAGLTATGFILQYTGSFSSDRGDGLLAPGSAFTLLNCIMLADTDDKEAGPLVSALGGAGTDGDIEHCTVMGTLGYYGETYAGIADMLRFKSCICEKPSGQVTQYKVERLTASTVKDGIGASTHNWRGTGVADGNAGRGYHNVNEATTMWTSGDAADEGIDPQDLQGDSQFVDSARNIGSWGQSEEGTDGSDAAALAVIADDPSKIAELIPWVRGGFAPQNNGLQDAGHDSVTIGAVEGIFAAVNSNPYYYQHLLAG